MRLKFESDSVNSLACTLRGQGRFGLHSRSRVSFILSMLGAPRSLLALLLAAHLASARPWAPPDTAAPRNTLLKSLCRGDSLSLGYQPGIRSQAGEFTTLREWAPLRLARARLTHPHSEPREVVRVLPHPPGSIMSQRHGDSLQGDRGGV